jgi:hypothetical protein
MAFKILIAEDEEITLNTSARAQKEGYLTIGTQNGQDALSRSKAITSIS